MDDLDIEQALRDFTDHLSPATDPDRTYPVSLTLGGGCLARIRERPDRSYDVMFIGTSGEVEGEWSGNDLFALLRLLEYQADGA